MVITSDYCSCNLGLIVLRSFTLCYFQPNMLQQTNVIILHVNERNIYPERYVTKANFACLELLLKVLQVALMCPWRRRLLRGGWSRSPPLSFL